ncbi:MAG: hypothetical protein QOJ13_2535 [Gaiellales bacterium]|nr:hypothetical protein [Gaiellales bacterium]
MRRLAVIAVLAAALAAGGTATSATAEAPHAQGQLLRVMSLNIFYGGDQMNLKTHDWCRKARKGCRRTLEQVADVIRASKADVVGIQEPETNTPVLARKLGWFVSERLSVISRYPLIDPPSGRGLFVYVQLAPGRVVAIANTHLPSDPYGPYAVRDGATKSQVLRLERSLRMPKIRPFLNALPAVAATGVPVFLTGDFNSPSHLDWTKAVAARRGVVRYPVRWPVAAALARAGLRDSYREAHPNPVATPGFTWTPGGVESVPNEVHDRIDWVLTSGSAVTVSSTVVGEPGAPNVGIAVGPYPSDHRGVVSTFRVHPASPPAFSAVDRRNQTIGQPLRVRFHGPDGASLALVPAGRGTDAAVAWRSPGIRTGSTWFGTGHLHSRPYDALLVSDTGAALSRSRSWLHRAGEPAHIDTSKRSYERGEPITVSWSNAPGSHWDWVGLFRARDGKVPNAFHLCKAGTCGNGNYWAYEYTRTMPDGTMRLGPGAEYIEWPVAPGRWEVRLLLDDGYTSIAVSRPFVVSRGA